MQTPGSDHTFKKNDLDELNNFWEQVKLKDSLSSAHITKEYVEKGLASLRLATEGIMLQLRLVSIDGHIKKVDSSTQPLFEEKISQLGSIAHPLAQTGIWKMPRQLSSDSQADVHEHKLSHLTITTRKS